MNAHNNFKDPNKVIEEEFKEATIENNNHSIVMPAMSVIVLNVE